MIALIDQYQKELLKVNGFAASTVETYTISIRAFCSFARNQLEMNPAKVKGPQLLKWILYLKNTGIGHSRIENHHYALKSFFAFVKKTGIINTNPAEALQLLIIRRRQRTKPISTQDDFKLLDSFDQSSWHGLRDYTMVSLLCRIRGGHPFLHEQGSTVDLTPFLLTPFLRVKGLYDGQLAV